MLDDAAAYIERELPISHKAYQKVEGFAQDQTLRECRDKGVNILGAIDFIIDWQHVEDGFGGVTSILFGIVFDGGVKHVLNPAEALS